MAVMKRAGDLTFLLWLYFLASLALSLFCALLLDPEAVSRHGRGAALLFHLFGPLWALEEAGRAALPVGRCLLVFALGGLVILPLLAAPLLRPGWPGLKRRGLGLLLWALLAAGLMVLPALRSGTEGLLAEGWLLAADVLEPKSKPLGSLEALDKPAGI